MEYILNKNAQIDTGYHKIHKINCSRRPKEENIIKLTGVYKNSKKASNPIFFLSI